MNIKNQQIEFDVFPKDNKSEYAYLGNIKNSAAAESAAINIVFSHQSVIIVCICAILFLVASFSLGVEKGKLLAKNSIGVEKPAFEKNLNDVPLENLKPQTLLVETKDTSVKNAMATAQITPIVPKAVENNNLKTRSGFTIQVASVKNENGAKSMMDFIAKKGLTSFTKPSGKYIIVLAGNFAKREEAQVKLKELKKTYTDCFIKEI